MNVDGLGWLIAAYIVFFAVVTGYIALLSWNQRDLDRRIDALESRVDRKRNHE